MRCDKYSLLLTAATVVMVTLGLGVSADAATLSISSTPPTVDGADIANLVAPTGGQLIWGDRGVQGSTFMTDATGGTLNAITVQINEGDGTILGWKDYTFRVGTVTLGSPNTINVLYSDLAVRQDPDIAADSYFTFTLDTPLVLAPSTLYGFDVGLAGSQEGWQQGIPQVRTSGNVFADGQRYNGGRPSQGIGTTISLQNDDVIFHADIDAATAVPEPSALALLATGLLALACFGRRRRGTSAGR